MQNAILFVIIFVIGEIAFKKHIKNIEIKPITKNSNGLLQLIELEEYIAYLYSCMSYKRIGYLLYSIYGMKAKNGNIRHTAHFGGAIGGYLITLMKEPNLIYTNTKMVILLTIPIFILFYLHKTNKLN